MSEIESEAVFCGRSCCGRAALPGSAFCAECEPLDVIDEGEVAMLCTRCERRTPRPDDCLCAGCAAAVVREEQAEADPHAAAEAPPADWTLSGLAEYDARALAEAVFLRVLPWCLERAERGGAGDVAQVAIRRAWEIAWQAATAAGRKGGC